MRGKLIDKTKRAENAQTYDNAQTHGRADTQVRPYNGIPQLCRRGGYYPPAIFVQICGNEKQREQNISLFFISSLYSNKSFIPHKLKKCAAKPHTEKRMAL